MTVTDPNTLGAAPWYQSPVQIAQVTTFVAVFIAMFPKIGDALGLKTSEQVNTAVTAVAGFIAVVSPFVGMVVRAKSKIQPLTLTQAGADNHAATLVATRRDNA